MRAPADPRAWFGLVLFLAPWPAAAAAPPVFPDALPSETLAYVTVDVGRVLTGFEALDLVRLYRDEEVHAFLAPAVAALQAETREVQAVAAMFHMYGLPEIIRGRVTLAGFGFGLPRRDDGAMEWFGAHAPPPEDLFRSHDMEKQLNDLLLAVDTSGRAAFRSALDRALEIPPMDVHTEERTQDGVLFRVTHFVPPDQPAAGIAVYHGFAGDTFLAALRPERLLRAARDLRATEAAPDSLVQDAAHRRFRAAPRRDGMVLEAYVAVERALAVLEPWVGRATIDPLRALGLDVPAVGFATSFVDGRIGDTLAVVLPETRRGVLRVLDAFPTGVALNGLGPAGAVAALSLRVDAAVLYDRLAELAGLPPAAFGPSREALGFALQDDLLDAFGSVLALHAKLPRNSLLPVPDVLGSLQLDDPAQVAQVLPALGRTLAGPYLRDLDLPGVAAGFWLSIPAPVTPAVAVHGDELLFALQSRTLRAALGAPAQASSGLSQSDDFQRCVGAGIGEDGFARAALLLYVDVPQAAGWALGMVGPFFPQIAAALPFELDPALLPLPETVADRLSGLLVTVRLTDDVVALDAASSWGGVLPLAAAASSIVENLHRREEPPLVAGAIPSERGPEAAAGAPYVGIGFDPNAPAADGVVVASVVPDGPAAVSGFVAGDVIRALDKIPVAVPGDLTRILADHRAGDVVVFDVTRGNEILALIVVLGERPGSGG